MKNRDGKIHLAPYIASLRPEQWTKNLLVFAALVFGYGDASVSFDLWTGLINAAFIFLLFCFLSSGIYLINDTIDRKRDSEHPDKKRRPIASGQVPVKHALIMAVGIIAFSITAAIALSLSHLVLVLCAYLVLQILYCLWLKQIALLDVFIIATGFVLRAIAGACATTPIIPISPWLILCTFLLALFLALCKRRHEKASLESIASARQRIALQQYDLKLTDQLIAIVCASNIVAYMLYTLSATTIAKFGSAKLAITVPVVMFGMFRYLDLLYRHNQGQRPEKILLTDPPIIITLITYAILILSLLNIP